MKKRILSILLAVLMLVSVLPVTALAADVKPPESNITAVKSAQWVEGRESEGIAKVTIQVSGKKPEESTVTDPTDIVLVIDRSESMDHKATRSDKDTKMAQAKAAAKQFAKKMLESDKVQIAVVTYTKTAQAIPTSTAIPFSGNYDTVGERIDSIKPDNGMNTNSGTNVQAGIHAARELLKASTATNK
ncbi:MAG: VWA domain-containing protein, partial [Clostridiales bacterium]|nr:VWA domain-containing protein [Clostridiales bacterium]